LIFGGTSNKSKASPKRGANTLLLLTWVIMGSYLATPITAASEISPSPNNFELILPHTITSPLEFLHGDLLGATTSNGIIRINRYNQLEWKVERPSKKLIQIIGRFSSIFALFDDGSLECLDDTYGFKKWEAKAQNITRIVPNFPYLLIKDNKQNLMALDMKTGSTAWSSAIPKTQRVIGDPRTNTLLVQHNNKISHVNSKTGVIINSKSFRTPIKRMYQGNHKFWLVETPQRFYKINKHNLNATLIDVGKSKDMTVNESQLIVLDREKKLLSSFSIYNLELEWLTPMFSIESQDEVIWGHNTVSLHRKSDNVIEVYNLQKGERVLELDPSEIDWDQILIVNSHPLGTQMVFPSEIRLYGHHR